MKHNINSTNTKQMLAEALISLSNKKDFSKITVSEIVDYCNINRKTFYYHFTDIYDLLEWHLNNELSRAISQFDPLKDTTAIIAYAINYINQCLYPSIISVYICESCIVLFLLLINNGNISVNIYKPASLS